MIINENDINIGIETFWTKGGGIGGSIKSTPSDFEVREIWEDNLIVGENMVIPSKLNGLYLHFTLEKRGIDTLQAIRILSRILNHSINDFGYAGIKDGNATTFQRISLWKGEKKEILKRINKDSRIKIHSVSYGRYGIKLGGHWGNQFRLIIRDIPLKKEELRKRLKILDQELRQKGKLIPNFFGSQRFGGTRLITHRVGRNILRREWKEAVMCYLCIPSPYETKSLFNARKDLSETENFTDFQIQLQNQKRILTIEWIMTKHLLEKPNDWIGAIQKLNRKEISLFIGAYQSLLFNKCLSFLIREFPEIADIPSKIPLIGWKTNMDLFPNSIRSILNELLENDRISLSDFKSQNRLFSSTGTQRDSFVKISNFKTDFLGKHVKLQFSLPKGSYATVLLREIRK
ncbi:MAG: tRNA pseudouridine(13) synthase TruD [Promethearchaeota archaeon]